VKEAHGAGPADLAFYRHDGQIQIGGSFQKPPEVVSGEAKIVEFGNGG
jgi:hypothetical protein